MSDKCTQAYLKIISEADEFDVPEVESNKETAEASVKSNPEKADVELKFSNELAIEMSNTINEFTSLAAQVLKSRNANKESSDRCYDLLAKIKNLFDAAGHTL